MSKPRQSEMVPRGLRLLRIFRSAFAQGSKRNACVVLIWCLVQAKMPAPLPVSGPVRAWTGEFLPKETNHG